MGSKQLGVVVIGVIMLIALYIMRSSPAQTNALDALLAARVDSLSGKAANSWQQLSNKWSGDYLAIEVDTLIGFWQSREEPAVAGALALQRAVASESLAYHQATADVLMEAVRAGRQGGAPGVNDNLLFYYMEQSAMLYNELLDADSTNLDARVGLAGVFIDGKGQIMSGVQQLLAVLKIDSLYLPANLRLGRLSMMNGEYGNVIKRMKKVLQVDSTMGEAYITIASAYQALGDTTAAQYHLSQSLPYLTSESLRQEVQKRLNEL